MAVPPDNRQGFWFPCGPYWIDSAVDVNPLNRSSCIEIRFAENTLIWRLLAGQPSRRTTPRATLSFGPNWRDSCTNASACQRHQATVIALLHHGRAS